jgi:hypothetical protein
MYTKAAKWGEMEAWAMSGGVSQQPWTSDGDRFRLLAWQVTRNSVNSSAIGNSKTENLR